MFDSKKLDDYFEKPQPLKEDKDSQLLKESGFIRFAKLGFPCVAAALLGLMVVMPNIHKSVDLSDNITLPRKSEMEKLHIEKTVFSATDNKNRVNHLTADTVDEVEPHSQKVKLYNPKGDIPIDNGEVKISADTGFWTQNNNLVELKDNVKAVINDQTVVITDEATYDFSTDTGYGKSEVKASGDWGNLTADAFYYDKNDEVLTLQGNSYIKGKRGDLTAHKNNRYYRLQNKIEAEGEVLLEQQDKNLYADKMVLFLSDGSTNEIKRAEAYGNVRITTAKEIITAAEGIYDLPSNKVLLYGKNGQPVKIKQDKNIMTATKIVIYLRADNSQEIEHVEAEGGVVITTPKGTAKGSRGTYKPMQNLVELWDNVVIEQDGNFVRGNHAQTDLRTSVSRIMGKQNGERISGTFYKKRKKDGDEKK